MQTSNHALIRILTDNENLRNPVGAGFLIAPDLVLSCAHVVLEALNLPSWTEEPPTNFIWFDFLYVDKQPLASAEIVGWFPVKETAQIGDIEDLVLLRLTTPVSSEIKPLSLVPLTQYFNRQVKLNGFPKGMNAGIFLSGVLKDINGEGRVQIDTEQGRGDVAGGFSGSAVYDLQENAVVGVVVSIDTYGDNVRAYMIPAITVLKAFPQLEQPKGTKLTVKKNRYSLQKCWILKTCVVIFSLVILLGCGLYYYAINMPILIEFKEQNHYKSLGEIPYLRCRQKLASYAVLDYNGKYITPITTDANQNMWVIPVLYLPKEPTIFNWLPKSWGRYYLAYINIGEKSGFYPQKISSSFQDDSEEQPDGIHLDAVEENSLLMILVTRHQPLNLIKLEDDFKRRFPNVFTLGSAEVYLSAQATGSLAFYYETKYIKHECYD